MNAVLSVITITLTLSYVRTFPNYWNNPNISPVHRVYVKHSSDNGRGDLFVAATEDSPVNSVIAPLNFLKGATAIPQAGLTTPDDSLAQKQSALTTPPASPPAQYTYVVPVPSSENNPVTYQYAYPVSSTPAESSSPKCDQPATAHHHYQFPYHYFYPQIMSAYSNAMHILKDTGFSEDSANKVITQTTPSWQPYAYPMYVMIAPSTCTQNNGTMTPTDVQTSTLKPPTEEKAEEKAEENEEDIAEENEEEKVVENSQEQE